MYVVIWKLHLSYDRSTLFLPDTWCHGFRFINTTSFLFFFSGFNHRWNTTVGRKHPNIWYFIKKKWKKKNADRFLVYRQVIAVTIRLPGGLNIDVYRLELIDCRPHTELATETLTSTGMQWFTLLRNFSKIENHYLNFVLFCNFIGKK